MIEKWSTDGRNVFFERIALVEYHTQVSAESNFWLALWNDFDNTMIKSLTNKDTLRVY